MTLRPYQAEHVERIEHAFRSGSRSVLGVMPTGGGKTVAFVELAKRLPGRGAIVTHRRELSRQALDKARTFGLDAAAYPSARPARVMVGGIQTLHKRDLPKLDWMIWDEAHHGVSPTYAKLRAAHPGALLFGPTATPQRLDGRGLGSVFDTLVLGPSTAELTAAGWLVPARLFGMPRPDGLDAVRMRGGEYRADDLARVMTPPAVVGDAVEHYGRVAPGRSCVVFEVSVEAAETSAAAFRAAGWRFVAVHGGMLEHDRDAAFRDLAAGLIHGLTACDLISEGVDIPDISCVIIRRKTASLGLYLQWIGRGLRPGKPDLIVLDHVGCWELHGFPDDPREWTLDDTVKRAAVIAPRQCPECFVIHRPALPRCPECGHCYAEAAAGAERRRLRETVGELAELSRAELRDRFLRTATMEELKPYMRTRDGAEEVARLRGYDSRWVDIQMRFRKWNPDATEPDDAAMIEEMCG